jgi:hypothetical protein
MRLVDGCFVLFALSATTFGCNEGSSSEQTPLSNAFVERTPEATLAWQIGDDGTTKLAVYSTACQPAGDATGTLRFVRTSDGKEEEVELTRDSSTGLLVGDGPDLDPELTEVLYDVKVDGQQITGALHVPDKGTSALVAGAAAEEPSGDEAKGAHGGTVENVGDAKYEVVADTSTGVVRVYPLAGVKVQQLRLGRAGTTSRVLVLHRIGEGSDAYYSGLVDPDAEPGKLTLVVKDAGGKVHVRLVGYRKSRAMYVGRGAPRARFWVVKGWEDERRELRRLGPDDKHDGKGKVEVCHKPPGNPDNQHTLSVGASAVAAHLAHGDHEGPCKDDKVHAKDKDKDKDKGHGKDKGEDHGKHKGQDKSKGKGKGH